MVNQNGQLILHTLNNFKEPATITQIVAHIADSAGVPANTVRAEVHETVTNGVRYGYIQRKRGRYYAAAVEDLPEGNTDMESPKEPEKRRGRTPGKRGGRGGRSRSRGRRSS